MHCIAQPRVETHQESVASSSVLRFLLSAVLAGWIVRLIVVAFVYQGFLDPGRDHWEFGYEIGAVAHSIVVGHGFANPYWVESGPTAVIGPVFPYILAGVFAIFGAYTKASALVFLAFNCLGSALTSVPVFFMARKSFGLRAAKWAAWVWAFFPYAINFSANCMWYHSFLALLLALLFLIALHLESSDSIWAWAGWGLLYGFSALVSPAVLGILPFLGGWVCYRLARQGKHWMKAATVGALVLIITTAPWQIRNYRSFHRLIPTLRDNLWLEVADGNVGDALHWWNADVHPAGSAEDVRDYQRLGELGYMAKKKQQSLAYIESHPGVYLLRSVRRVGFIWTGFWSFNREYLHEEPLDPENIFFLSVFSALSFVGLYKAFRKSPATAMPYFLVLLTYPVVYYLTYASAGLRHPMDPIMVVLASFAVVSWLPRPREASVEKEDESTCSPVRADR